MTTKRDWIKSQLLPLETDSDAASRLNTPVTIGNPTPQPQILTPITLDAIRKIVADKAEAFKVQETDTWQDIKAAIAIDDRATIRDLIATLVYSGTLTQATAAKLLAVFATTIPDPDWQARIAISPAELAGYSIVYTHEVQEAIDNA